MNTIDVLLASLDEAYERKAWHGTNLRGSLRGLAIEQLVWRPEEGRNNIWELTLHIAYWTYAVRRRLTGEKRGSFPLEGSNFFASPERPTEDEWKSVLALLDGEQKKLREVVAAMSPADLRDAKKVRLVYGVTAHHLYHTGQIQLLKRLQK